MNINTNTGWSLREMDNGYLCIIRHGKPGEIVVKADDEGFVVDIWSSDPDEPEATAFCLYTDLEPLEDAGTPDTLRALIECADYLAEFLEEGREHRVIRAADAAIRAAQEAA